MIGDGLDHKVRFGVAVAQDYVVLNDVFLIGTLSVDLPFRFGLLAVLIGTGHCCVIVCVIYLTFVIS